MEEDAPQNNDNDEDWNTNKGVINLMKIELEHNLRGFSHLGETLEDLMLFESETTIVAMSSIHFAYGLTNIAPPLSSLPQASGGSFYLQHNRLGSLMMSLVQWRSTAKMTSF